MIASVEEIKMNALVEEVKIDEIKNEEVKNDEIKEISKELDEIEIEIEKMKIQNSKNEEKTFVVTKVEVIMDETAIVLYVLPISDSVICGKILSSIKKYENNKGNEEKQANIKKKIVRILKTVFKDVEIDKTMDLFEIMNMLSNGKTIEFRGKWDYYGDQVKFLPHLEESFENLRNYSIGKMITSINCVSDEKGQRITNYAINFSNGETKHFSFFDGEPFSDYTGWIEFHDPYSLITKKMLDKTKIKKNQFNIGLGLPASGKTTLGETFDGVVFDDCQLDIETFHAIINALMNGKKVYVCNSLFCDTRYLEYFLSCIGIVETGLIKFIFFVPNPYQSSLNIKKRETNEDRKKSLLISLKKLSLIYTPVEMHKIKDKYSFNNFCFVKTYEPPKNEKNQDQLSTIQKSSIALNKKAKQDEHVNNIKSKINYPNSIPQPQKIDWSLLSPNQPIIY